MTAVNAGANVNDYLFATNMEEFMEIVKGTFLSFFILQRCTISVNITHILHSCTTILHLQHFPALTKELNGVTFKTTLGMVTAHATI